jgi:archaellum component FlaC
MAQKNVVEYILDIKTKAAEEGLEDVVDALEKVEKELKKTQKESEKTEDKFEKFKKAGMAVGKVAAVMAAVGVAILGAGKAAFEASRRVTDLVNELNDLSVRSGVSAKTIQGLRQAMLSSGQSAEGLTEVLGAISGQFAQLSTEGSAVEKKFMSFGIAVKDTNGELRSNNDILLDAIKLLQGISDSSERSRAAVTLFGEAGAKLNQALAAGDFERFLSFTEKFGIDAGPEASRTAAQFQVVLSGLGTVLNGTLQKFVSATDGQNRFIQGMIKLGGILAFTGSLFESFSDEISFLTDKFLDFLNFGLRQTIALMGGPFTFVIGSAINALNFLGLEVEFLNKAMSNLAGFTLETIDPSNKLRNAIDKATEDMKEYEDTIGNINISLDAFQTGSQGAANELDDLGKEAEKTTEKIRTLNDVINDLFKRFTSFDVNKFISDFSIIFNFLNKSFDQVFNVEKIDRWVDNLKDSFNRATTAVDFQDGVSVPEITFEGSFMGKFEELITKLKIGTGEAFSKAVGLLGKAGGKIGSALSTGISAGAATAITGILAVIGIASKLGQRGETVAEIEKSVEQDIRAQAKAIELGLQALPRILFNVLPPLLVEFADRIVFGFFKSIAEFVNILINGFKSIFTREGRQSLKEGIKEGFRESIEEFFRRVNVVGNILSKRSGGRYIPSARGGIKFTGADEGLAMLHRGEFVVPETGQMPQAVQRTMGMGQSGINITINASVVESNAIDELVRQIERRFQTFGSSTSPLFGGR